MMTTGHDEDDQRHATTTSTMTMTTMDMWRPWTWSRWQSRHCTGWYNESHKLSWAHTPSPRRHSSMEFRSLRMPNLLSQPLEPIPQIMNTATFANNPAFVCMSHNFPYVYVTPPNVYSDSVMMLHVIMAAIWTRPADPEYIHNVGHVLGRVWEEYDTHDWVRNRDANRPTRTCKNEAHNHARGN